MTDHCREIINFLNCGCELFQKKWSDRSILKRWEQCVEEGKAKGYFPLLVIPSKQLLQLLKDQHSSKISIEELKNKILSDADEVDVHVLLNEGFIETMEALKDDEMYSQKDFIGSFRETKPSHSFISYYVQGSRRLGNLHNEIILAKIPVQNPWELAAWVPMGGFNACPSPAEQVAAFRYWFEVYGAIPAVVGFETWEMKLTNPPATFEAAEILAKEHFSFCDDIVSQIAGTLRNWAGIIKDSTTWYFWWD